MLLVKPRQLGRHNFLLPEYPDLNPQTGLPAIRVYPNPAADRIYVVSEAPATLVVDDATGKKAITSDLRQRVNSISITQLSKGVYFGQTDGGERFTFIKK